MQTLFYNVRLVDAFCDTDGAVLVENGFISDIFWGHIKPASIFSSKEGEQMLCIDGKGLALMPAFVDMHAHFRYPGLPQKEELDTALRAAAAGGFGTLLLMPNTKPVVSSPEQAKKVQLDAQKHNLADVIQTLSITGDFGGEDTSHLDNLDCTQFPVVSEDGFDVEAASVMFEAMKKCAKNNIIVSCHCEDVSLAKAAKVPRKAAIEIKQSDAPDQEEIKKNMADKVEFIINIGGTAYKGVVDLDKVVGKLNATSTKTTFLFDRIGASAIKMNNIFQLAKLGYVKCDRYQSLLIHQLQLMNLQLVDCQYILFWYLYSSSFHQS